MGSRTRTRVRASVRVRTHTHTHRMLIKHAEATASFARWVVQAATAVPCLEDSMHCPKIPRGTRPLESLYCQDYMPGEQKNSQWEQGAGHE